MATESVVERFNRAPFYLHMGLQAEVLEPGRSRVTLPWSEDLLQAYGGIHGGAILALADSAISIAIYSLLSEGEAIATVELSTQFIAAVGRNDIAACGEAVKKGRRLAFGRCEMTAGDRLVVVAQGVWHVGEAAVIDGKLT